MKKTLKLLVAGFVAALALAAVINSPVRATTVGDWEFPTFRALIGTFRTSLTVTGPLTVSGTVTNAGNQVLSAAGTSTLAATGTAAKSNKTLGLFALTGTGVGTSGQNTGINVSSTIFVNSSFETLLSSAGAIQLTSTPSIATTTVVGGATAIPDGMILVLTSTTSASTVILQDNGTLSGSLVELGAATRTISLNKTLTLMFVSATGKWVELAFGNN